MVRSRAGVLIHVGTVSAYGNLRGNVILRFFVRVRRDNGKDVGSNGRFILCGRRVRISI